MRQRAPGHQLTVRHRHDSHLESQLAAIPPAARSVMQVYVGSPVIDVTMAGDLSASTHRTHHGFTPDAAAAGPLRIKHRCAYAPSETSQVATRSDARPPAMGALPRQAAAHARTKLWREPSLSRREKKYRRWGRAAIIKCTRVAGHDII